ncbi:MAG: flagellin [Candidatus Solibacter sp.]
MLSTISPAGQQFVNSINDIQARLAVAQQQISSSMRVSQPSDAPDQISPILQLHSAIHQNADIQNGLNTALTTLKTGESSLSSAIDMLQSASVTATQATSTNQTAATRATLAQSVQALMEQMVSNSRTTAGGRYVFSGDLDGAPLYQLNLADPTGVDRLQVASATSLVQGTGGSQYAVSLSGNTIFDPRNADLTPATGNAFAALNGLRVALLANDLAGIASSIGAIGAASTYMNDRLSFYGQAENRVTADLSQAQTDKLQLQTELSGKTDADMTQAITALTEGTTQLQAALSARARMPHTSLFDVLPL